MKSSNYFLLAIIFVVNSGCSNSNPLDAIEANSGNVIIVKSNVFADEKFHYGAFKINNIAGKVKTLDGKFVSIINYEWMLEDNESTNKGISKISDIEFISFGEEARGIIGLGWSYASQKSVYLYHMGTFNSEKLGIHYCVTDLKEFPDSKLSNIECKYNVSKTHND